MESFPQTSNGNQYLLIMTEYATRWLDEVAIPDQRAKTVTGALVRHIVANHGVPKAILTDQGPCFESEEFKVLLQELGIKKIRTTPYHPQTNGLTERNNHTLKEWLAIKGVIAGPMLFHSDTLENKDSLPGNPVLTQTTDVNNVKNSSESTIQTETVTPVTIEETGAIVEIQNVSFSLFKSQSMSYSLSIN
ncbi:unnamed protein product [Trichobilharzia regenti]|nr:unnamed protein product [Trichobilharzia regenti]